MTEVQRGKWLPKIAELFRAECSLEHRLSDLKVHALNHCAKLFSKEGRESWGLRCLPSFPRFHFHTFPQLWTLFQMFHIPFCRWAIPWRLFPTQRSVTERLMDDDMMYSVWLNVSDSYWWQGLAQHRVWLFHCLTSPVWHPYHFGINYFRTDNDQVAVRISKPRWMSLILNRSGP